MDLAGCRMAILGGDRRELEAATIMHAHGAVVRAVGLPWPDDVSWVGNRLEETVPWADILIAPVGGVDEVGTVLYSITNGEQSPPRFTAELLESVKTGAILLIGKSNRYLNGLSRKYGVRLIEFRERDDFATLNSVPSAEGAIQMAMEQTLFTICGAQVLVLGFGRTGTTLARMLHGIGAHTLVAARGAATLARIEAAGYTAVDISRLSEDLAEVDLVFNTVPALILNEECLAANRKMVVIDLASAPGGTDFAACKRLGIKALLAPGLPGKVAPVTAGKIVASVILRILQEEVD